MAMGERFRVRENRRLRQEAGRDLPYVGSGDSSNGDSWGGVDFEGGGSMFGAWV